MATIDSSLGKGPVAGLEKPPVLGREQEVEPDYSPETQELVGKMTNGIEKSEALAAGLGRVAKEGIFLSGPERDAIYAREEVGKTGLGVFDVGAFEQAGRGLQIKNRILEWLGSRSEYALTGKQGLVDTRKLKSSEAGKEQLMSDLELRAVALELGLKPEEAAESELKKTYAEGRRGAEKVITRKATEKEAETAAAGILEKRLKELETDTGAKLVKDREGLEVFKKEKADNASILEAADVAKLEEEAQSRESLIEERKRDLLTFPN